MRKDVLAGAAAVGAALIGGAAVYYLREKQTEEPDYRALASDGDFQIRDYPAMTVAETVVEGPRKQALERGLQRPRRLYLRQVARRREIADDRAGDAGRGRPDGERPADVRRRTGGRLAHALRHARRARAPTNCPTPPEGVELVELPPRKVAVVSFAGRPDDVELAEQEDRLRGWLARRGETSEAEPEYAFYNSPVIPGPLRRNEVWLALS